jgi:hypothetical protein
MNDDDVRRLLNQAPLLSDYLIEIRDQRVPWPHHVDKLDSALALLNRDNLFSLRKMPPPPTAPPFGNSTEEEVMLWRKENPNHPWALSWANNDRLLEWASDMRKGKMREKPDDVDPFRESRRASLEIHSWAFVCPSAFGDSRLQALSSAIFHWDCGVTFDLVRAVYWLRAHQLAGNLRELITLEEKHGLSNSWTHEIARTLLLEWAANGKTV